MRWVECLVSPAFVAFGNTKLDDSDYFIRKESGDTFLLPTNPLHKPSGGFHCVCTVCVCVFYSYKDTRLFINTCYNSFIMK